MRLLALLILLLAPLRARAETPPPVPLAVLQLEAAPELEQQARSVTALLASHLAEPPELQVLTSADLRALREVQAQQLRSARYVVTGRLDRHGERYLLTTALLDSQEARPLARPRTEASSEAGLPDAASDLAEQLLEALRRAPGTPLPVEGGVVAGLRVNNSFVSRLRALNPGGEVELGYRFHPEWVAFVQVGVAFVRRGGEVDEAGRLNVVPSVLGARHFHRIQHALQPYWGLGLGLQLSFGQFGVFSETGTLPTVVGFAGLEYRVGRHLGLQVELGTNVAQALLGLGEDDLGDGLNLDLNAGLAWHF